jgi:hypothetical protein
MAERGRVRMISGAPPVEAETEGTVFRGRTKTN